MEFSRVGEQRDKIEGTGIGLAVSQKIARLMNGDISVDSELGKGSTFSFHLPADIAKGKASNGADFLKGKTVLYVDDDTVNRILFEIIMQKNTPARILLANCGQDGIELARLEQPDLVISDMDLGDMTGTDMLQGLKANSATSHIPVMALSGSGSREQIAAAHEAGFLQYLMKPLHLPSLLAALRSIFLDNRT